MKDKIANTTRRGGRNQIFTMTVLLVLLIFVAVISIMIGRYPISPSMLWMLITGNTDAMDSINAESASIILFNVRIARIVAAVIIGAALSTAGAAYQGIFRNPVVSPDILGAATGASFGAVLAIYLGGNAIVIQISAFCFGLLAVAITFTAARLLTGDAGGTGIVLVLTGMVVASLFSAFISVIKFVGDPYDTLPTITFWLMGGLTYVESSDIYILIIPFLTGIIPLLLLRWKLNVLSMDDEEASALGLNTQRMRLIVILCATLMSSSAVAVGGMIGWVGLIVPHIARMITGPDYAKLLPCSVLTGGLFLLVVDDFARCMFAQELPLGVLTAIIGAPFFLGLMFKGKKSFL